VCRLGAGQLAPSAHSEDRRARSATANYVRFSSTDAFRDAAEDG
jgi:hypothetical protein